MILSDDQNLKPIAGDEALGLELLQDGKFRIHGLEFENKEQRLTLRGLGIERAIAPESLLAIKQGNITKRFAFFESKGLWYELAGGASARAVFGKGKQSRLC
jgi:hypothetical protein